MNQLCGIPTQQNILHLLKRAVSFPSRLLHAGLKSCFGCYKGFASEVIYQQEPRGSPELSILAGYPLTHCLHKHLSAPSSLTHKSIRTQSLCSVILFLPVTSRRPDFQITAELSDFDPLVLVKWGLLLWSSSTPSLLFEILSPHPLLLKVINNNVFYVPSP